MGVSYTYVGVLVLAFAIALTTADLAERNLSEGRAWLEANAKKEGVVTLATGLQYKKITSAPNAKGPSPTKNDRVQVHYHGTTTEGKKFDSSYDRGSPATFGVTQVIKGWTEILQLMKVGDKWEVYIPSELAYGSQRRSDVIGPNQTLVFIVELIEIVGKKSDL